MGKVGKETLWRLLPEAEWFPEQSSHPSNELEPTAT